MRVSSLLSMFLFFVIAIPGWTFQNEPPGFRGFRWGDKLSQHKEELSELSTDGAEHKMFTRRGDKLSIGGATLTDLTYVFYKDEFAAVQIITKGTSDGRALREAFSSQFGAGNQDNPFIQKWTWLGPTVFILLSCGPIKDECSAQIASVNYVRTYRADRAAKAASGAKDF